MLADVEDGDDVRMMEPAGRSGLARKALTDVARVEALAQQLDGDRSIDGGVARKIEHTHAAAAESALDLVAPDRAGKRLRHGHGQAKACTTTTLGNSGRKLSSSQRPVDRLGCRRASPGSDQGSSVNPRAGPRLWGLSSRYFVGMRCLRLPHIPAGSAPPRSCRSQRPPALVDRYSPRCRHGSDRREGRQAVPDLSVRSPAANVRIAKHSFAPVNTPPTCDDRQYERPIGLAQRRAFLARRHGGEELRREAMFGAAAVR